MHPCEKVNKALEKFSEITDGLLITTDSMKSQKHSYHSTKRTMELGLEHMGKEIMDIGKSSRTINYLLRTYKMCQNREK